MDSLRQAEKPTTASLRGPRKGAEMRGGTQAAVAIAVGYVLGRRRKMRMATVLAAAAATGGLSGIGGTALKRGAKLLGSTELLGNVAPQFRDIAETVRGDLVDAGKAAAVAAVNGRIESLTDSLHDRAETLRNPAAAATEVGAQAGETVRGVGRRARRGSAADDEADQPADQPDDEAELSDDEEQPEFDEDDEVEGDEVEGDEREPAPRRRSGRSSAPVVRTRR